MRKDMKTVVYRSVVLPGLGRVKVPEGVTDTEVLDQVLNAQDEATPLKKTKKKSEIWRQNALSSVSDVCEALNAELTEQFIGFSDQDKAAWRGFDKPAAFWRRARVFQRKLEQAKDGRAWDRD